MTRRGFSTIEMIIVMLVGMAIIAMAVPTLASEIRRISIHEDHAQLDQSVSSMRRLLRRDLNRAGYLVPDSVIPLSVTGDTLTIRFESSRVNYYVNGNGLHRWQDGSGHLVAHSVRSFATSLSGRTVWVIVTVGDERRERTYSWFVTPRNLLY